MADPFATLRLRTMDALRRDVALTTSARLVGLEIYAHLNKKTGTAWPSQQFLAKQLGISIRTVKRAVIDLVRGGWIKVDCTRHYNQYCLALLNEQGELVFSKQPGNVQARGARYARKRGQIRHQFSDKKVPLTLTVTTTKTLAEEAASSSLHQLQLSEQYNEESKTTNLRSREISQSTLAESLTQPSVGVSKPNEYLRERRGDERYEAIIAERYGPDGYEILGLLNQIDNGAPRLKLIRLARSNCLSDLDLAEARILAISEAQRFAQTAYSVS